VVSNVPLLLWEKAEPGNKTSANDKPIEQSKGFPACHSAAGRKPCAVFRNRKEIDLTVRDLMFARRSRGILLYIARLAVASPS
jgi:hypothetical protein